MSWADVCECPSCGGTDFVQIGASRSRCEYCGRSLTKPQATAGQSEPVDQLRKTITCYRCRADNDEAALYCNRCGSQLTGLSALFGQLKGNPATLSIAVSLLGSLVLPPFGAVVGLILAYGALGRARSGMGSDEKAARVALLIGWGCLAFSALPLCLIATWSGARMGLTLFENVVRELLSILGRFA